MAKPGERPLDRLTGDGFVKACDGDYADALSKGYRVTLLLAESTGALAPAFIAALRSLAKLTKRRNARDTTRYGIARFATKSFFAHHVAAIAHAAVIADTLVITNKAATMAFADAHLGHPPAARA